MQRYEFLAILPQLVADTEVATITSQITEKIRGAGATIVHEENLGRRKLAYTIGQSAYGTYVLVHCDAEAAIMKTIEQSLKLMHEILRYSIVKIRIRSAEEIARERTIQEKIEKQMSAAPHGGALAPAAATPVAETPVPQPQLSTEDLTKKLDEILEKPEI